MTSLPPPKTPEAAAEAATATPAASSSSTTATTPTSSSDANIGPVTKLAAIAAEADQKARLEARRLEHHRLQAQASLVGETALAIAAATASGSPVRLSPAQQQTLPRKELLVMNSTTAAAMHAATASTTTPTKNKLSVAARARMAADLPRESQPARIAPSSSSTPSRGGGGLLPAPPLSGNAGVTRGKFSKAQVKQMIDEWGRSDTSDDDEEDDDDYDDYYYDGTSEDNSSYGDHPHYDREQFKQTLERSHHHLQYTMSNSPGPSEGRPSPRMSPQQQRHGILEGLAADHGATGPSPPPTLEEEEEEFHYQHHKVSAYSMSKNSSGNNLYGMDGGGSGGHNTPVGGGSPVRGGRGAHEEHDYQEGAGSGGGIFASAKTWFQLQRERLHQIELERQVEDQRRKLVEEGRRQRAMEADRRRRSQTAAAAAAGTAAIQETHATNDCNLAMPQSSDLLATGSFGCIDASPSSAENPDALCDNFDESAAVSPVSGMPVNLCGFGGVYANQLNDDSTDYSGVARVDSAGNILELIPSGSLESFSAEEGDGYGGYGGGIHGGRVNGNMKVRMKVSSPKCTLSGKGMSVKVDIPDIDEYVDSYVNVVNTAAMMDNVNKHKINQQNNNGNNKNNSDNNTNNIIKEKEEDDDDSDEPTFISDIKIVPEPPQDDITSSPPILQQCHMKALISSGGLPASLNFCKWKRLYSLTRDGDSFEQFLRCVQGQDRTVLAVRTTRQELFGGYADTRWEAKHFHRYANEFYGSAQAILFRFPNYGECPNDDTENSSNTDSNTVSSSRKKASREDKVNIYKWSGANRYIQLCDAARRMVAFGGGGDDGDFGLCIEDDFRRGTTGHCSTFENDALCDEGYFDVMDLEVWGFALDYF